MRISGLKKMNAMRMAIQVIRRQEKHEFSLWIDCEILCGSFGFILFWSFFSAPAKKQGTNDSTLILILKTTGKIEWKSAESSEPGAISPQRTFSTKVSESSLFSDKMFEIVLALGSFRFSRWSLRNPAKRPCSKWYIDYGFCVFSEFSLKKIEPGKRLDCSPTFLQYIVHPPPMIYGTFS